MPPKGKKSKSSGESTAKYLFVNEDVDTVLGNTRYAEVDRSKQSHVQRRQFEKKRAGAANAVEIQPPAASGSISDPLGLDALTLVSQQNTPCGLLSPSDYFNLFDPSTISDDPLAIPSETDLYGGLLCHPIQLEPFAATSQPSLPTAITNRTQQPTLAPLRLLPRGSSRSGGIRDDRPPSRRKSDTSRAYALSASPISPSDPFCDTFVALQRWAPPLIQYYTTVMIPHLFATELKTVPMQLMRHTPALHAEMEVCMAEAAHMYAQLAAVSARMLRYEGHLLLPDVKPEDYSRVPLFFKTKAITSLRHKLERGQLNQFLAHDVFRLWVSAVMMDDQAAADAHSQAMIEMVRDLGGLHAFDDYTKERMILLDIWSACWTLTRPKFQLTWDPGHFPETFCYKIRGKEYQRLLGSTFDRTETLQTLDVFFGSLISGLTELVNLTCYSFTNPLAPTEFRWLLLRRTAIEHRLLFSLATVADDGDIKSITEATKLTVLVWIGMVLVNRNKQLLSHQVNTLREWLEPLEADLIKRETKHKELLLWISSTAAMATLTEDDKKWFVNLASRMAEKLEIETLGDMEEHLHGLLYVREMQRKDLGGLMGKFETLVKGKGKGLARGEG